MPTGVNVALAIRNLIHIKFRIRLKTWPILARSGFVKMDLAAEQIFLAIQSASVSNSPKLAALSFEAIICGG